MIEIRETTKPAERSFRVDHSVRREGDGGISLGVGQLFVSEAELRELVEKGAEALGLGWPFDDPRNANYRRLGEENARLRGWLEAIAERRGVTCRKIDPDGPSQMAAMAGRALAGEEAPRG